MALGVRRAPGFHGDHRWIRHHAVAGSAALAGAVARCDLEPQSRRLRNALFGAITAVVLMGGASFIGFSSSGHPIPSPKEFVETALRLASVAGGPRLNGLWPVSGIAITIGAALTVGLIVRRALTSPAGTLADGREIGLLCYGVSVASMMLGVRGTPRHVGMDHRLQLPILRLGAAAGDLGLRVVDAPRASRAQVGPVSRSSSSQPSHTWETSPTCTRWTSGRNARKRRLSRISAR